MPPPNRADLTALPRPPRDAAVALLPVNSIGVDIGKLRAAVQDGRASRRAIELRHHRRQRRKDVHQERLPRRHVALGDERARCPPGLHQHERHARRLQDAACDPKDTPATPTSTATKAPPWPSPTPPNRASAPPMVAGRRDGQFLDTGPVPQRTRPARRRRILQDTGRASGIYSTPYQFGRIAGGTARPARVDRRRSGPRGSAHTLHRQVRSSAVVWCAWGVRLGTLRYKLCVSRRD